MENTISKSTTVYNYNTSDSFLIYFFIQTWFFWIIFEIFCFENFWRQYPVRVIVILWPFPTMSITRLQFTESKMMLYMYHLPTLAETVLTWRDTRDRKWNAITDRQCCFQHISCHHILPAVVLAHLSHFIHCINISIIIQPFVHRCLP